MYLTISFHITKHVFKTPTQEKVNKNTYAGTLLF